MTSRSPVTIVPPPAELRARKRERETSVGDWVFFALVIGAYVAMLAWALTMPAAGAVR